MTKGLAACRACQPQAMQRPILASKKQCLPALSATDCVMITLCRYRAGKERDCCRLRGAACLPEGALRQIETMPAGRAPNRHIEKTRIACRYGKGDWQDGQMICTLHMLRDRS